MKTKDYFSGHSKLYATFRPTYPDELYRFIFKHVKTFDHAWDCATGNGQVSQVLSKHFNQVFATDISQRQLDHAYQASNIHYSKQPAEKTNFPDQTFDLITVAQAFHWFEEDDFYSEVKRTAKPVALLAVWGYTSCSINPEIDVHYLKFYHETVGSYWDSVRRLVEEEYRSVPFPFVEISTPKFAIRVLWSLEEFAGYLTTWSATQKFIKDNGFDPVPEIVEKLRPLWNRKIEVKFPVFLKLGRVN